MLLRRRALSLVSATALGLVALGSTACAEQSAAVRVGDQRLSESALLDEVGAFVDNEVWLQATGLTEEQLRGDSDASFSQTLVGDIITQRVQFMFLDQLFADEGLELSAGDLSAGRQQFDQAYQAAAAEFPESYREQVAEDIAQAMVLQDTMGQDEVEAAFRELVETTDVVISSRYGTWDREAFLAQIFGSGNAGGPAIIPPDGPRAAAGGGGDAG